eukprot:CAMPEP_0203846484 /NCGR_PEP_ID=MMETSP0359-20131031/4458_1 /ASSEMBLY_ACC=CAM_ASM_000338 /TAXON_ID=268821 /ORGANISM="Scrippsiella Hangoei, Strain SHTV-5" /LENGTH=1497 /DNA_ID=CAMNT_0050761825 /DNA_START=1 /DNA_END=4494 /DNA_ORIENTATION=-
MNDCWNNRRASNVGETAAEEHQSAATLLRGLHKVKVELHRQQRHWSAANFLQSHWRGVRERRVVAARKKEVLKAVGVLHRSMQRYIWRKRMVGYVKDYLTEIDELDLLANDQELLTLRAKKLIERGVRIWIDRRRRERRARKASEKIQRAVRGFLARRRLLVDLFSLDTDTCMYFPERVEWGFRILLNCVHRLVGLERLSDEHPFEVTDYVALRLPDPDEVAHRSTTALKLRSYSGSCIVRPLRCGRFPGHAWDGPIHRLPDAGKTLHKLTRSSLADFKAFAESCTPGQHPLIGDIAGESEGIQGVENAFLKTLLSDAEVEPTLAGPLKDFLEEARKETGPAWPKRRRISGVRMDPHTGRRSYRDARWTSQRLLVHRCANTKVAAQLFCLINGYNRASGAVRGFVSVPFLPGTLVHRISAATAIQASIRAHWERVGNYVEMRLPSGRTPSSSLQSPRPLYVPLLQGIRIRRAAVAIQRCWKWSILKRRMVMLSRAREYVESVRSTCIHIEDRLFTSLNLIASTDRYTTMLRERMLSFGMAVHEDGAPELVLVRQELAMALGPRRRSSARSSSKGSGSDTSRDSIGRSRSKSFGERRSFTVDRARGSGNHAAKMKSEVCHLGDNFVDYSEVRGGLPKWLTSEIGAPLREVGPDDPCLQGIPGIQGLLLPFSHADGGPGPAMHEVSVLALAHLAKKRQTKNSGLSKVMADEESAEDQRVPSKALLTCGGSFRLRELRFASVAQAKAYALALFMCTFSLQGGPVPLLGSHTALDFGAGTSILRLWDLYGLAWAAGDRTAIQRARQLDATRAFFVPCCGNTLMQDFEKPDKWVDNEIAAGAAGGAGRSVALAAAAAAAAPAAALAEAGRAEEQVVQQVVQQKLVQSMNKYDMLLGHDATAPTPRSQSMVTTSGPQGAKAPPGAKWRGSKAQQGGGAQAQGGAKATPRRDPVTHEVVYGLPDAKTIPRTDPLRKEEVIHACDIFMDRSPVLQQLHNDACLEMKLSDEARLKETGRPDRPQKQNKFSEQFSARRRRAFVAMEEAVMDLSLEELQANLEHGCTTGNGNGGVSGVLPPTTGARVETQQAISVARADKAVLKEMLEAQAEAEAAEKRRAREMVTEWRTRGKEGLEFEDRIYAFHGQVDEEKRAQETARKQARNDVVETRKLQAYDRIKRVAPKVTDQERSYAADVRDVQQEVGRGLRAQLRLEQEELERLQASQRVEEHRTKKAEQKAAKAVLRNLASSQHMLQRAIQAEDKGSARRGALGQQAGQQSARAERWDLTSRALQHKNEVVLHFRDHEVEELKLSLVRLTDARDTQAEIELQAMRAQISDAKTMDRLVRAAREQLSASPEPFSGPRSVPKARSEYEDAVAGAAELAELAERAAKLLVQQKQDVIAAVGKGAEILPMNGKFGKEAPPLPPKLTPRPQLPAQPPPLRASSRIVAPGGAVPSAALASPRYDKLEPLTPRGEGGGGTPRLPSLGPNLRDAWCRKLGAPHLVAR